MKRWAVLTYAAPCNLDVTGMMADVPHHDAFTRFPEMALAGIPIKGPANVAADAFRALVTNRWGQSVIDAQWPRQIPELASVMDAEILPMETLSKSPTYRFLPLLETTWCGVGGTRAVSTAETDERALHLVARELGVEGMMILKFDGFRVRRERGVPFTTVDLQVLLYDARGKLMTNKLYGPLDISRGAALKGATVIADNLELPDPNVTRELAASGMDQTFTRFMNDWATQRAGGR